MLSPGVGSHLVRPSDVSVLSSNGYNGAHVRIAGMGLVIRALGAIAGTRIAKLCTRSLPILTKTAILGGAAIVFGPGAAPAAVPELIQHVATAMDRFPVRT